VAIGCKTLYISVAKKQFRLLKRAKLSAVRAFLDEGIPRANVMERYGIASKAPLGKWVKAYRGRKFDSFEAFKMELGGCIVYWNKVRQREKLNGLTPIEFRCQPIRAA